MDELLSDDSEYELAVTSTRNPVGGGTTPGKTLPGAALQIRSLNGKGLSAQEISDCLRKMDTPILRQSLWSAFPDRPSRLQYDQ